jgi:WD40 repeat protein
VRAVGIAPDGTWLATGSDDRTVRLWDAATGARRAILTGHTGSVNAVAIAPDSTWLATACTDGMLRIWNVADGTCVAMMHVEGSFTCCAWDVQDYKLTLGGPEGLYRFAFRPPAS